MIDTLRRLRRVAPRGVRLRLLIGADQATQFHLWKHHRAILRLAEPIVLPRTPILTADALRAAMDARTWTRAEREAWAGRLAPVAPMPAAATDVRKAIPRAPRDPARWTRGPLAYVPRHVARYIANHHLYEFGSTSRDRSAP